MSAITLDSLNKSVPIFSEKDVIVKSRKSIKTMNSNTINVESTNADLLRQISAWIDFTSRQTVVETEKML